MTKRVIITAIINAAFLLKGINGTSAPNDTILPYKVHFSDATLKDLRNRIQATRLPNKETVADRSQGPQLNNIKELVHYWGNNPAQTPTKDEVLNDITLYWLTNSAASAARIYWENKGRGITSAAAQKTAEITIPVAITVFAEEVYRAPETWARKAYKNLIYFNEVPKGGHFVAWEQPQLFTQEMRAAFKSLR